MATTTSPTCIQSLNLLGDAYTLRIVDALANGERHFCELQRDLDNLNPVTLTNRLKKLESAHLLERLQEPAAGYRLTPLGREVLPVISAVDRFARAAAAVQ